MTSADEATDPVCGMSVNKVSALHGKRDGKTFYFCSDHCRQKFFSAPTPQGDNL